MMIHHGSLLITIKLKNMFNNKQEYIVCSAILKIEETEQLPIYNSFENDLHKICIGLRHADILYNIVELFLKIYIIKDFLLLKQDMLIEWKQ